MTELKESFKDHSCFSSLTKSKLRAEVHVCVNSKLVPPLHPLKPVYSLALSWPSILKDKLRLLLVWAFFTLNISKEYLS